MIINHNIAALNTHRQMGSAQSAQMDSMEKLSSGLRINSAKDDAAGLTISEKMRGQIRGLEQASTNAQDGISLIQTAEGSLSVTQDILQRMRELSVQAANDTMADDDRAEIQKEVGQLKEEIDRISKTTEFNTKNLLDGNVAKNASSAGSFNGTKITGVNVINDNMREDTYTVAVAAGADEVFTLGTNTTDATGVVLTGGATVEMGSYTLESKENETNAAQLDYVLKDSDGKQIATTTLAKTATTAALGGFDFTVTDTDGTTNGEGSLKFTVGQTATFTLTDSSGAQAGSTTITNDTTGKVNVGGMEFSFNSSLVASTSDNDVKIIDNSLEFQIGANEGHSIKLAINSMDTAALNIDTVDVSSKTGAQTAITKLETAIQSVSSERSKLGSVQNRLEHTINNLGTSAENLTSAESRIRDVDYAEAA